MGSFRVVVLSFAVFLLTALAVFPQEEPAASWNLEYRAGPMWIGNAFQYHDAEEDEQKKVHGSSVSPLKVTPGIGIKRNLTPDMTLKLAVDGLYQEYVELPANAPIPGKVVPTSSHIGSDSPYIENPELEQQNVAGVLIMPLHVGLELPLFRRAAVTTGPGFGFNIVSRIPFLIAGETTENITAYHWGNGRFLYPELNWTALFHTFDRFDYGIRLRALYQVANLWAREDNVAWWDGTKIQLQAVLQTK